MTGEIDQLACRQIFAVVERTLVAAGVAGAFPTPLEPLQNASGIREVLDMSDLPDDLVAQKPKKWRSILGALLYREQTVFVDRNQSPERVCSPRRTRPPTASSPGTRRASILMTKAALFREAKEKLELEANLGGALIIFQGTRFHERALQYTRTINTPILLASEVGASYHATIRHYVEYHPDPLALAVAGRYPHYDGHVPIWTTAQSPVFRQEFGPIRDRLPAEGLPLGGQTPLGALIAEARKTRVEPPSHDFVIRNLRGDRRAFTAEAFYNQHCVFVMFAPRAPIKTGRRVAVITR
jgi:hypothetical protein